MSVESKTYHLFKGKMQASELYFANRKLYDFLCIHWGCNTEIFTRGK